MANPWTLDIFFANIVYRTWCARSQQLKIIRDHCRWYQTTPWWTYRTWKDAEREFFLNETLRWEVRDMEYCFPNNVRRVLRRYKHSKGILILRLYYTLSEIPLVSMEARCWTCFLHQALSHMETYMSPTRDFINSSIIGHSAERFIAVIPLAFFLT